MTLFQREQRTALDQLIITHEKQMFPRRAFLRSAVAMGLSVGAASTLLTASDSSSNLHPSLIGTSSSNSSIIVMSVWSGEELATWQAICAPFTQATHIPIQNIATRDLDATLMASIQSNQPPDVVGLPNLSQLYFYASQQKLLKLDTFLNMDILSQQYSKEWLKLASYQDGLYALWLKGTNKATVWYSPKQFAAIGAQVPTTWDEMLALSDKIAASKRYPWSMGVRSGAASGWPATDWIAEIYLRKFGPEMYDRWVTHQIPWTHSSIITAFQTFGQIIGRPHYIKDAPRSILSTSFDVASYAPFTNPPQAYMYYLGDYTAGFITSQFPKLKPGIDFDYFPFPAFNTDYQDAITVAGDIIVAMRDSDAVRQFMLYLSTPEAQSIWVKRGGATSVNEAVDLSIYPNDVARASATMLASAPIVRFGAGDQMPSMLQRAYWKGALEFIDDPRQLYSILSRLEVTARFVYAS